MPEPANASNPAPNEGGLLRSFRISGDFLDVVRRHIVNLTLLFGSLGGLWAGAHALGWSNWFAGLVAAGPPVIVYLWVVLPQQLVKRRQASLIQISRQVDAISGETLVGADYFLIGPYPPQRRMHYRRADGVHDKVLHWVRQLQDPVLILTGESGTGKSSLLQAYVIPELEAGAVPFKVLTVRSFDNPLEQLRQQLTALWERVPDDFSNLTLVVLLERVLSRIKRSNADTRLLIVFDQFEEFIILPNDATEQDPAMLAFLQEMRELALADCIVMFSLRSEYRPYLERLGLPPLREGVNWLEVPAFIYSDAAAFLRAPAGELNIEEDRLHKILTEAAAVDGTPKLIRPIILNMLGVVMRRIAGRPPSRHSTSRLLEEDLYGVINDARRRDVARLILPHLITDADTKRPRTIGELFEETRLDPSVIHGCLLDLELSGYARQLRRSDDICHRLWEVSHDFVARLLGPILKTPWGTKWNAIRPYLFTIFLLSWLVALIFVPSLASAWGRLQAETILRDRYQFMLHKRPNGYTATQVTNEDENLKDAFVLLAKLNPVTTLNLGTSIKLQSLDGIEHLTNLTEVYLADCLNLKKLDGLGQLSELQSVNLRLCGSLTNVRAFSGSVGPQSLELSFCSNLETLDGLQDSHHLQSIFCDNCINLTNIDSLRDLSSLQTLNLDACPKLTPSDILRNVPDVQYLSLAGWKQLTNLASLQKLSNLEMLNLAGCVELTSLDGLQDTHFLEELSVSGCVNLADIDAISQLADLSAIDLSGCLRLTKIDGIKNSKDLVSLDLSDCKQISDFNTISEFLRLKNLNLSNCVLSTVLPLAKLAVLEVLNLHGNQSLINFEGISALKSLKTLNLSMCNLLPNLGDIRDLPKLESVNAESCASLVACSGFSHVPKLVELRFCNCVNLVSLEGIQEVQNLESINLYGCSKFHDILPLQKCFKLKSVDLRQIKDLNLADVARLKKSLPQANIQISEEFYKSSEH